MAHDNTRKLTDVEWAFVYGELNRAGAACSKHPRLRGIVDSIFWVSRYKTSWTALPSSFPPHSTCYGAFYRWKLANLIQPIFQTLGATLPEARPPGVKSRPPPESSEITANSFWYPRNTES
jgi:hypothetical protein